MDDPLDDLPEDLVLEHLALGAPRTRGRAAKPIQASTLRLVTEADIASLANGERGTQAPPIKALRERHHVIAQLIATGKKPGEVAAITGYSLSRVSILQADPQFNELVDHYASMGNERVAELRSRMTTMSLDALNELQTRLEDNPDDFTPSMLLEVVKVLADRTGHNPRQNGDTNLQVNVNLTERMQAAAARVQARPVLTLEADVE